MLIYLSELNNYEVWGNDLNVPGSNPNQYTLFENTLFAIQFNCKKQFEVVLLHLVLRYILKCVSTYMFYFITLSTRPQYNSNNRLVDFTGRVSRQKIKKHSLVNILSNKSLKTYFTNI